MTTKKIKLEDLSEADLEAARNIVHWVCRTQTARPDPQFILPILAAIKSLTRTDGLLAGLLAGLDVGLHAGLDVGLHAGLDVGLYAGLDDGLRNGLDAGLYTGLRNGLLDGKLKLIFCGVFWSWWLCRYMIAAKWGCPLDMKKLQLLFGFCFHTPIVLEDEKKRIIIAKPTKINWRVSGVTQSPYSFPIYELHSDGESTVECAGIKLYHWHNVRMPKKYGSVHSSKWEPKWFVEESNVELKRILAEQIGYERLFHALEAKKLDSWREYELFRIEGVDVEPVHILTMVCPSTGKKHFGRVPPDCMFARDAAKARNCGIDPEEFWVER